MRNQTLHRQWTHSCVIRLFLFVFMHYTIECDRVSRACVHAYACSVARSQMIIGIYYLHIFNLVHKIWINVFAWIVVRVYVYDAQSYVYEQCFWLTVSNALPSCMLFSNLITYSCFAKSNQKSMILQSKKNNKLVK